ncbi:MAG: ABC transporter ATP-binding protein [Clostridia bacterium]|nr:ABC transporter ATP-binding protein [Clostridia bacterium]
MIEIDGLKKLYHERTVLDVPSLRVQQGGTLALAGANGSGKTTLLRILAGNLQQTEGSFCTASPVLYLPQRTYAFRGTVLENTLLGAKDQKEEALRVLEELELIRLKDKKASSLSGGELQRLAFCRLLVRSCRLLLLDEPTSACDAAGTKLLLEALGRYRKKTGCTVILSTHAPTVALRAAQRLLILNDGRIEADGEPQTVLQSPGSPWTKQFVEGWKL